MKKILSVIIAFCLLLSLTACGGKGDNDHQVTAEIIDGAGRSVHIPSNAKEATVASVYYVAAPFFAALGIEDRVLALNTRNSFLGMANETLGKAGTVGKGTVDLEKLATYAPTALVHRSNDPKTVEAVERLGIDVICITVENADDILNTLNLLGSYFGAEEKAKAVSAWFKGRIDFIDGIVAGIPENERKTAMLIGGEFGRVAGKDMIQSWMIEKAGGIPVVQEGKDHNWIDIGAEKVLSYDPEYLFCTASTAKSYSVEDLYSNDAYSAMTAVMNKHIYDVPTKLDAWDMPGLTCVLGIMYMLHEMYPDHFTVEALEDEVDSYYRFMYGRCFDEELGLDWESFE